MHVQIHITTGRDAGTSHAFQLTEGEPLVMGTLRPIVKRSFRNKRVLTARWCKLERAHLRLRLE